MKKVQNRYLLLGIALLASIALCWSIFGHFHAYINESMPVICSGSPEANCDPNAVQQVPMMVDLLAKHRFTIVIALVFVIVLCSLLFVKYSQTAKRK